MFAGHRHWIDLLNEQETWRTDDAMLRIVPKGQREFESEERWPRLKALAFLNNNVQALRMNYEALEAGENLDLGLLTPILDGLHLGLVDPRRDEDSETSTSAVLASVFRVLPEREGWNAGTAALRQIVQRATFWFARYVELRLCDAAYPAATPGLFRVLGCAAPRCRRLVAAPTGFPGFCGDVCAAETGEL